MRHRSLRCVNVFIKDILSSPHGECHNVGFYLFFILYQVYHIFTLWWCVQIDFNRISYIWTMLACARNAWKWKTNAKSENQSCAIYQVKKKRDMIALKMNDPRASWCASHHVLLYVYNFQFELKATRRVELKWFLLLLIWCVHQQTDRANI